MPPNANLYAKRDMILPPFSQNRVEVFSTKFLGSGYVIAPTKIKVAEELQAAWGVCNEPEWVQLLNPTDKYIQLRKNTKVAKLFETGADEVEGGLLLKKDRVFKKQTGTRK